MHEFKNKPIFNESSLNFDNIPVKETLFQNTAIQLKQQFEEHETTTHKSTVELFSEFFQRAEIYQKNNVYANVLSKDLSQPIIIKENFIKSTGLSQKDLIKSK